VSGHLAVGDPAEQIQHLLRPFQGGRDRGEGFVPFDRIGGELLFNLLSERYETRSTIVTTNLTFGEWVQVGRRCTLAKLSPQFIWEIEVNVSDQMNVVDSRVFEINACSEPKLPPY
jgi:IstB-like ATP binding protein